MSNLKISNDEFLGREELIKFRDFPFDFSRNLAKLQAENFGLIKLVGDTAFNNLRVVLGGSANKLTIKAGRAIDSSYNHILVPADLVDNITIPATANVQYYVKIKYAKSNDEPGVFSIDAAGNLVGGGSSLTNVLRGQPNFASKIRFTGTTDGTSVLNTQDYEVVIVTDDTHAVLQNVSLAAFTAQSNLKIGVVGTFAPGVTPASGDKMIFDYDGYTITLSTNNTVVAGVEFVIASVFWNGSAATILDTRVDIFKTKTDLLAENISFTANPIIGLDSVEFDNNTSAGEWMVALVEWGFRGVTWTYNQQLATITISSGDGGILKSPVAFTTGWFDGWRCYFDANISRKVITSTKSGSNIVLQLDQYLSTDPTTGTILIVPDCDKISIRTTGGSAYDINQQTFPVMQRYGIFRFRNTATIAIVYSQIWNKKASNFVAINDGAYSDETGSPNNVVGGLFTATLDPDNLRAYAARLDKKNIFTKAQIFHDDPNAVSAGVDNYQIPVAVGNKIIVNNPGGHTVATISDMGMGCWLIVQFQHKTKLIDSTNLRLAVANNMIVGAGSICLFHQLYDANPANIYWELVSCSDSDVVKPLRDMVEAYLDTNQHIAGITLAKVGFNQTRWNADSYFDTTTHLYTTPREGYYKITFKAQIYGSCPTGTGGADISIGGVVMEEIAFENGSSPQYRSVTVSRIVKNVPGTSTWDTSIQTLGNAFIDMYVMKYASFTAEFLGN